MLTSVWKGLVAVGRRIGQAQTWLLLTLVYLLGVGPVALVCRFVTDPLRLRRSSSGFWHAKGRPIDLRTWATSQF